jgi:hypothetical protein
MSPLPGLLLKGKNEDKYNLERAGDLIYDGNSQGAKEVGCYDIIPKGYLSDNYLIVFLNGELRILPSSTSTDSGLIEQTSIETTSVPIVTGPGTDTDGPDLVDLSTSDTFLPDAQQLKGSFGQSTSMIEFSFDIIGDTASITLDTPATAGNTSFSISLLRQDGDTYFWDQEFSVAQQGQRIQASSSPESGPMPKNVVIDHNTMRTVTVDYGEVEGIGEDITIGLSSDGILLIEIPESMGAMDEKMIVLLGLAIAKEELDVEIDSIWGTVIKVAGDV